MQFRTLNFSLKNPALAPLASATISSSEDYINIPTKSLPSAMLIDAEAIYAALTGKELDKEQIFVRARIKDKKSGVGKQATKLYAPAVYRAKEPGQIQVRWGNEFIKLQLTETGAELVDQPETDEDLEPTFAFERYKIRYDESVLMVTIALGDDEVSMPFPLKSASFQEPIDEQKLKQFKSLCKRGRFDEAAEMLAPVNEDGTSAASNLPLIDARSPAILEGVVYILKSKKSVKAKWGQTHIVTIEREDGESVLIGQESHSSVQMWSTAGLNGAFGGKMKLPVKFYVSKDGEGDDVKAYIELIDAEFENGPDTLSLDFLN